MATTPLQPVAGSDPKAAAQLQREAKAQKVAQEFESIFTTMMLRSMRGTTAAFENDFMPNDLGQKIYTEMLDDEYGKLMAGTSKLGLAKLVLDQIHRDDKSSASSLQMLTELKLPSWMIDKAFVPTAQMQAGAKNAAADISKWKDLIQKAGDLYGVDANLISAIIVRESGGNPDAVSAKGAKGLMQLMDSTAGEMGIRSAFNPEQNILAGTKYFSQMLERYKGDASLALAAYNAGPAAVDRYGAIPPYDETRNYVSSVLGLKDTLDRTAPLPRKEESNEIQSQ
jgi:Rod binding domain-containing protein